MKYLLNTCLLVYGVIGGSIYAWKIMQAYVLVMYVYAERIVQGETRVNKMVKNSTESRWVRGEAFVGVCNSYSGQLDAN